MRLRLYYPDVDEIPALKTVLQRGKENIKELVCANCTGKNITRAKGASVYFPRVRIGSSYVPTLFAQQTQWLLFLEATL